MGLLALSLAMSRVFPQAPSYVRSDQSSFQEWLSAVQIRFKGWTTPLYAIGVFHIGDTLWFRAILALLAFVLLTSLGEQLSRWLRSPPPPRGDEPAIPLSLPPDSAVARVREAMQALVGRVRQEKREEGVYLRACRSSLTALAPVVTYLGLLGIVCGLAVDGRWGWEQADVQLLPGTGVVLGPTGRHRLELVETRPPLLTPSVAVIRADGREVAIRPGNSVWRGAYIYHLQEPSGLFVRVGARRSDGAKLTLYNYTVRPEPADSLSFTFVPNAPAEEADRLFIVSPDNLVVRIRWSNPTARDEPPLLHLWVFAGQEPIGDTRVVLSSEKATATIGSTEYMLDVSRYIVLDVARRPGWWPIVGGCVLAAVGLLGATIHREAWAMVTPGDKGVVVRLGGQGRAIGRQGRLVDALRTRIEEEP